MDVGLNNRNILGLDAPELNNIVFLVKANTNEVMNLWQQWSGQSLEYRPFKVLEKIMKTSQGADLGHKLWEEVMDVLNSRSKIVDWIQISAGFILTIGYLVSGGESLPINIAFQFAMINGKKIAFYYCCSRGCDIVMIEKWLIERFQLTHDNYTRWNHVDATNFHNCINSLEDLDIEPRDTVYQYK